MSTTAVGSTGTSSVLSANPHGNTPLDKTAFLKLLVTQLSNQDPLKPTDDTQFISQLAQFSGLEQMQNLNTSMSGYINAQNVTQSTSMIGKAVQYEDSTTGKLVVGQVKSVAFDAGTASLVVSSPVSVKGSDGSTTTQMQDVNVALDSVKNVFDTEDTAGVSSALGWVGKNVTGTDYTSGKSVTGLVTGVEFHDGITVLKVQSGDKTSSVPLAAVASVSQ